MKKKKLKKKGPTPHRVAFWWSLKRMIYVVGGRPLTAVAPLPPPTPPRWGRLRPLLVRCAQPFRVRNDLCNRSRSFILLWLARSRVLLKYNNLMKRTGKISHNMTGDDSVALFFQREWLAPSPPPPIHLRREHGEGRRTTVVADRL